MHGVPLGFFLFLQVLLPQRCWAQPMSTLSMGEQSRAQLARSLVVAATPPAPGPAASGTQLPMRAGVRATSCATVCIDEFSSTIDRQTAQAMAVGVAAWLRTHAVRPVVVAACHADVVEALRPDWLFLTGEQTLLIATQVLSPPTNAPPVPPLQTPVVLAGAVSATSPPPLALAAITSPWQPTVAAAGASSDMAVPAGAVPEILIDWQVPHPVIDLAPCPRTHWTALFHSHHYLTSKLHGGCRAYLARWQGVPVGFVASTHTYGLGDGVRPRLL